MRMDPASEAGHDPRMTADQIYLDHNATTPVLPEVLEAMLPYFGERFGNPSSGHAYGRAAHAAVERAREQVAALIDCEPEEVLFTSGGTEANNLALAGVALAQPRGRRLVISAVEHPAIVEPCRRLAASGWDVGVAPVDAQGMVRVEAVAALLKDDTSLVSVMLANNETGTLMPLRGIAARAHARGVVVHTDAAQACGKVPISVDDLGLDLLSIAGHKLYAPKGIGALYVRRGTPIAPFLRGASHERGLRPGTENVPGIVGLGAACRLAAATLGAEAARVQALRDDLWRRLQAAVPGIALSSHPTDRLPNTLNVRFPGVLGADVLARAPEVAAATGAACHADGSAAASAVLLAMGVPAAEALGAVRLSLGRGTTAADVEAAATALGRAWRELRE
jgi:cysteine desulfurase